MEQEKAKAKRAEQQKMVANAEKKLLTAMDEEQRFLIKQKQDKDEKEAEVERVKLERKAFLKRTMEENRQIWMVEKAKTDNETTHENQKYQEKWRLKNIEIEKRELAEHSEVRGMNKNLATFHKRQAEEKETKREKDFIQDLEEARDIASCIKREDEAFMSYAERCTRNWEGAGKNITPMILELQKQKKNTLTEVSIR